MKINCLWLPDQMTQKFCLTCSFCFVFNCFVCFKLMEKYFNLINGISCFYRLMSGFLISFETFYFADEY